MGLSSESRDFQVDELATTWRYGKGRRGAPVQKENGTPVKGIYSTDFSRVFCRLLDKSGVSCYQISQYSHVDEGYLSRLRSGEKQNPSPQAIVRIGLALTHLSKKVTIRDIEELFNSVGRSLLLR